MAETVLGQLIVGLPESSKMESAISSEPWPELICSLVWEAESPVVIGCHANSHCSAIELIKRPFGYVSVIDTNEVQHVFVVIQSERVAGLRKSRICPLTVTPDMDVPYDASSAGVM